MTLFLYNTLTRKKEEFVPLDPKNVRMYVCGPTVYGRAHLGNARSVVVYDVLFRLLRHLYGPEHVTYARNITDVDDKINAAALARKITIKALTTEVTEWFHEDMKALNVLPANDSKSSGIMIEPKATDHIPEMIKMIEKLISNGAAYVSGGHVLFSVASCRLQGAGEDLQPATCNLQLPYYYGRLSGRVQEELEAGARVKVESYKRDPSDFVLWKPADGEDDPSGIWGSPWGKGRPGWHIECSAMSTEYLGHDFDIHGGGSDLMFPHHENEIAQSCGAYPGSHFAKYWVHNGFLTVNGEKMSKSLGNFITVKDLLDKGMRGEVIRYALLKTKYNEPLDWSEKLLSDAKKELDGLYRKLGEKSGLFSPAFYADLSDDLNTPKAMSILHMSEGSGLREMGGILGVLQQDPEEWFKGVRKIVEIRNSQTSGIIYDDFIDQQINARIAAKKAKNWAEADRIRNELKSQGILLEDRPDGTTDWRRE